MNSNILLSRVVYLMMPAVAWSKDENLLHRFPLDNVLFSSDSRRTRVQIGRHSICVTNLTVESKSRSD